MEHLWGLQDGVPWYSEAGPGHGPASGPGPAEGSLTTAHSHSARGPFLGTNETWHQEVPPIQCKKTLTRKLLTTGDICKQLQSSWLLGEDRAQDGGGLSNTLRPHRISSHKEHMWQGQAQWPQFQPRCVLCSLFRCGSTRETLPLPCLHSQSGRHPLIAAFQQL